MSRHSEIIRLQKQLPLAQEAAREEARENQDDSGEFYDDKAKALARLEAEIEELLLLECRDAILVFYVARAMAEGREPNHYEVLAARWVTNGANSDQNHLVRATFDSGLRYGALNYPHLKLHFDRSTLSFYITPGGMDPENFEKIRAACITEFATAGLIFDPDHD